MNNPCLTLYINCTDERIELLLVFFLHVLSLILFKDLQFLKGLDIMF